MSRGGHKILLPSINFIRDGKSSDRFAWSTMGPLFDVYLKPLIAMWHGLQTPMGSVVDVSDKNEHLEISVGWV